MSNRNEQIAKTRRRVARRMMRTQILSFYGLERRIQNRQRQRRAGKPRRAAYGERILMPQGLVIDIDAMRRHSLFSNGRLPCSIGAGPLGPAFALLAS